MSAPIIFPQPVILAVTGAVAGQGLNAGHVYIGVPGEDPVTNPQATYWDADLTVPAMQPLDVIGGYIYFEGSPSFAWTTGSYSFAAYAKDDTLVYQDLVVVPGFNSPAGPAGEDVDFNVLWTGPQTDAATWLDGESVRRPVIFPANFAGSGGLAPETLPTATYTVTIKKNADVVGTAVCDTSGDWTFATVGAVPVSFAVDDAWRAYGSGDTTIADISVTFTASVGV